jgi:hypothetical protein
MQMLKAKVKLAIDTQCATLNGLTVVFLKFVTAQEELESDAFGTGSRFAGDLMGI